MRNVVDASLQSLLVGSQARKGGSVDEVGIAPLVLVLGGCAGMVLWEVVGG